MFVRMFCSGRLEDLKTKGSRLGTSLPHGHGLHRCVRKLPSNVSNVFNLLVGVGACLSVSEGSGNLAVLGQVEGGDLLSLLNLLLVGLHLELDG